MSRKQLVAIGGAVLLIVGSFMAWATIDTVFGSLSKKGIDGDGKLTAAAGGIALFLFASVKHRSAAITAAVFAGLGGAVAVVDFFDISSAVGDVADESNGIAQASVGVGLYLCLIGAGMAVVAGVMWAIELGKDRAVVAGAAPTSGSPLPPPPPPVGQ